MDLEIEPSPGDLLRRLREAAGFTQQQLADRAGTTQAVISRFEVGLRTPTLVQLGRLLHCLELQLTLGAASLWATIDAELDVEADRSIEERFTIAAEHRLAEGFALSRIEDTLGGFEHRYCGLTAAALLGAPVRPKVCDLMLLGREETLRRFTGWLDEQWAQRWDEKEGRYSGLVSPDPREPGALRWETPLGKVAVTFVEAFPPSTTVTLGDRRYDVVGLAHLDADDPHAKRVLARVRERLASGE